MVLVHHSRSWCFCCASKETPARHVAQLVGWTGWKGWTGLDWLRSWLIVQHDNM
jgi:hypothetical protein